MTAPDRDSEFEAFLKRRTLLPNTVEKLEPPAALDEIVLDKAREAVHAPRQSARPARWATPMALAATILLCFAIVLNVSLNRPTISERRVAAASQPATADMADRGSAPMSPTPAPAPDARTEAMAPSAAGSLAAEAPRAALPPQMQARAREEKPRQLSEPARTASRTSPQSAFEGAPASDSASSPTAPSSAASAPALATVAKRKAGAQASHPQDPKVWLRQIASLRSEGKTAQADAEMQRFRAVFPAYRPPSNEAGSR
jgi:hypothetical protein